jgi:hypothetical protein
MTSWEGYLNDVGSISSITAATPDLPFFDLLRVLDLETTLDKFQTRTSRDKDASSSFHTPLTRSRPFKTSHPSSFLPGRSTSHEIGIRRELEVGLGATTESAAGVKIYPESSQSKTLDVDVLAVKSSVALRPHHKHPFCITALLTQPSTSG